MRFEDCEVEILLDTVRAEPHIYYPCPALGGPSLTFGLQSVLGKTSLQTFCDFGVLFIIKHNGKKTNMAINGRRKRGGEDSEAYWGEIEGFKLGSLNKSWMSTGFHRSKIGPHDDWFVASLVCCGVERRYAEAMRVVTVRKLTLGNFNGSETLEELRDVLHRKWNWVEVKNEVVQIVQPERLFSFEQISRLRESPSGESASVVSSQISESASVVSSQISVASSRFFSQDKSIIAEKLQKRIREKGRFTVTIEDDEHIEIRWRIDRVCERDAKILKQTLSVLFCRNNAMSEINETCLRIAWPSLRDSQVRDFKQKYAEQTLLVDNTNIQRQRLTSISEALSIQERQRHWSEMLASISSLLAQNARLLPHLKTGFISYAWYPGDTNATEILQAKLRVIVEAFRPLGLDVYLDIQRMSGNIDSYMSQRIEESQVIFVIGTPQLVARASSSGENNLKTEYQHIRARQRAGNCKVIPLLFEGTHGDSFPNEATRPWLSEFIYDLRDLDRNISASSLKVLSGTENPLGLIPTLWELRHHEHVWQLYRTAYELLEHRCRSHVQDQEEELNNRVIGLNFS